MEEALDLSSDRLLDDDDVISGILYKAKNMCHDLITVPETLEEFLKFPIISPTHPNCTRTWLWGHLERLSLNKCCKWNCFIQKWSALYVPLSIVLTNFENK